MAASPTQESGDHSPRQASPSAGQGLPADGLTIRSLVTTREAGIIIGKQGKNVAELREQTGVKAGVSKVVAGVHERVLSVTGTVEGVAKAYGIIVAQLLTSTGPNSPTMAVAPVPTHTSLRLLISHNLMGTIIGRNGAKIKAIQDASGARMIAAKEMLPQSTERVVEIQGTTEGIAQAVEDIGRCLLEDWERGLGTVPYHPTPENEQRMTNTNRRATFGSHERRDRRPTDGADHPADSGRRGSVVSPTNGAASPPTANLRTQNISIPSDMVGCIIGKSGSKITEIRRLSGCKISIAKTPHDETGERMFTIVGTPEANEKALFLLYNQLESEKERRVGKGDSEEQ